MNSRSSSWHRRQAGPTDRAAVQREVAADLATHGQVGLAMHHVEVDHAQPVAGRHGHRGLGVAGHLFHQRAGERANRQVREHRVAERHHAHFQLVLAAMRQVTQIAQPGQGVGQTRHRRLRQAGLLRQFLVAQQAFPGRETAQQFQPAGQRGDELAVLEFLVFLLHRVDQHSFEGGHFRFRTGTFRRTPALVVAAHSRDLFFKKSIKQNHISHSETNRRTHALSTTKIKSF